MVLLAILAGLALRVSLFPLLNTDLTTYVLPWLEHVQARGFGALGDPFTDYAPGYTYVLLLLSAFTGLLPNLVLIKLSSVVADLLMALVGMALVLQAGGDARRALLAGAALLLLPTVLLNSGAWGQSDSIWAGLMLWALLALMRRRTALACLLWGIALAFKPQAVFLAPVVAGVVLARRAWLAGLLVPLPYLLLAVPPILAGQRWTSVLGVYAFQAYYPRALSSSVANLWAWLPEDAGKPLVLGGIALGAVIGLVIMLGVWRLERRNGLALLAAAALAFTALPFVLPKMHDRYFYGGEVLALLLCFLRPGLLPAVLAGQVAALLAYQVMLLRFFEDSWRTPVGGAFNHVAVVLLAQAWQAGRAMPRKAAGAPAAGHGASWPRPWRERPAGGG